MLAIGLTIDGLEMPGIGAPAYWVATAGVVLFAALPVLIYAGTSYAYAVDHNVGTGWVWAASSVALLAAVIFLESLPGGVFTALITLAALAFTLGGRRLFLRCLPALFYLLLVVGPPSRLDEALVLKLQQFAAKLSSKMLDQMGILHSLNGVSIVVGSKSFFVEDGV